MKKYRCKQKVPTVLGTIIYFYRNLQINTLFILKKSVRIVLNVCFGFEQLSVAIQSVTITIFFKKYYSK